MWLMMKTRTCNKCGNKLPLTIEYFYKQKDCIDGFRQVCKTCVSKHTKQYKSSHKEKIAKQSIIYRGKNKEQIEKYERAYRENNKEKEAIRHRIYKENNKEKIIEIGRLYRENNKEKIAESNRKCFQGNKEAYNIRTQIRRARQLLLPSTLTPSQWESIKLHFNNKCAYCGQEKPLEQEHFIAMSKLGGYTNNNIICACRSCNASKNNKSFEEWYPKYKYYSKQREKIILKFLGYDNKIQQLKII